MRINRGDRLAVDVNATSQLYYVMYGRGTSVVGGRVARWEKGDFVVLPAVGEVVHHADADTVMYWVHDEPLLRYLGVAPAGPRLQADEVLARARRRGTDRDRRSPGRQRQEPGQRPAQQRRAGPDADRHARAVGDVRAAADRPDPTPAPAPVGRARPDPRLQAGLLLAARRPARRARRDRRPGAGGLGAGRGVRDTSRQWHAHHNESGAPAHLIPIQDAGLQTYLRSLDIRFTDRR
ncbi:hypothetical protein ACU686_31160 [Yinghuangia aomiensis]